MCGDGHSPETGNWKMSLTDCDTSKQESAGEVKKKEMVNLTELKSKGGRVAKTHLHPPSDLHHPQTKKQTVNLNRFSKLLKIT